MAKLSVCLVLVAMYIAMATVESNGGNGGYEEGKELVKIAYLIDTNIK